MVRHAPTVAVFALLALAAASCSGDDGKGAAAPATGATQPSSSTVEVQDTTATESTAAGVIVTSPSDRIGCRVQVSGDVTAEFTAKDDGAALSSDHYLSQEEIDRAVGLVAESAPGTTSDETAGEEPDLTAPPRPEGAAPVVAWFLLNCQGGDITLNLYSNPAATKEDVPFGKGKYQVSSGAAGDDSKDFAAFIVFGANPEPSNWLVDEGASISIDRFDSEGASGSFTLPMSESGADGAPQGAKILVEGVFDVTCKEGGNCSN